VGETFAMPPAIIQRMARFHLADNTRGEPDHWSAAQVRSAEVRCEVVRSDADEVRLKLTGSALLSTQADGDQSRRGYDAALAGDVRFDRRQERFTRFDLLVPQGSRSLENYLDVANGSR
jgi:hypothetical protein